MLQTNEIQKRFSHLQQTISEASRTLHSNQSVPQDLMDCMDELDRECQSAQGAMSSQDEDRIRQCVDDMELLGDRAEQACQQAGSLDGKVRQAVTSMHDELSDFKRQIH
ncbi:hypothetical protein C9I57_10575 [Trinickia symbiotica]|uniref:Uncharacterized protein n=1 Tax=Trinickia symbiotica TaxID=863227 RepID=A0A2T3XXA0_9BURK|nr:hypothetical protein [Trinickia symbiotica]PTB21136.1 hypothetical protein C9I57_10575 [Trinickia symbiotica]